MLFWYSIEWLCNTTVNSILSVLSVTLHYLCAVNFHSMKHSITHMYVSAHMWMCTHTQIKKGKLEFESKFIQFFNICCSALSVTFLTSFPVHKQESAEHTLLISQNKKREKYYVIFLVSLCFKNTLIPRFMAENTLFL
jgi:hypothetical protein